MRLPTTNDIVLLTGASGQLGQEWKHWLHQSKLNFIAPSSAELDFTNLSGLESFLSTKSPTYIINCAAYTKVDLAEDEPDIADLVNHKAVSIIGQYSKKHDIPLIHYSTDYVFNGKKSDIDKYPNGYPILAPGEPTGVYGKTKYQGELTLLKLKTDLLIVRVAWLCGKAGNNFVKTMLRLSESMNEIRVVSDQKGSPSFTFDVVRYTTKLLEQHASGIRHISSKGTISWADFAKEIMNLSDKSTQIQSISSKEYPTKAKRPLYSKLDCSQTEADTGEEMPNWHESLKKLLAQIKS